MICGHRLAETEGMLVGGSAGLNVACAVKMAGEMTGGGVIVAILCDSGIKYLSKIYNREWLDANCAETSSVASCVE